MEINKIISGFIVLVLLICSSYSSAEEENILDKNIDFFEVKNGTMGNALRELSYTGNVQYGFEYLSDETLMSNESEQKVTFSITLKNVDVREILNVLIEADSRYYWEEDNNIINVMPVAIKNNAAYVLNRKVANYTIINKTKSQAIGHFLHIPELSSNVTNVSIMFFGKQLGSTAFPKRTLNINIQNVSAREILNTITRGLGSNYCWSFHGEIITDKFVPFKIFICHRNPSVHSRAEANKSITEAEDALNKAEFFDEITTPWKELETAKNLFSDRDYDTAIWHAEEVKKIIEYEKEEMNKAVGYEQEVEENIELKQNIKNLQEQVSNLRTENTELQNQISDLNSKISNLESAKTTRTIMGLIIGLIIGGLVVFFIKRK